MGIEGDAAQLIAERAGENGVVISAELAAELADALRMAGLLAEEWDGYC